MSLGQNLSDPNSNGAPGCLNFGHPLEAFYRVGGGEDYSASWEPGDFVWDFTDAEIKFLRSITESEPDWAAVKAKMPSLAKFEDEQLRTAWVNSGTDISALWKTPVGPVLIINLILWATGASWCDTPLGVAEACMGR